jgi:hypothetical protein
MKIVFDVGCMDGAQGLEKVLAYGDPDYRLYAFEAHPEWAQVARQKFATVSPNCILVEMAASDKNGTASFNMCRRHGASSLLKFKDDATLSKYWPGRDDILYSGRSVTVNTIRLDTFLDRNPVPQIDYLNIDVQGMDLQVLQSMGKYIDIVKEGCCEAAYNQAAAIYEGQQSYFHDIVNWLKSKGFEVYKHEPNATAKTADSEWFNEYNIYFKR